MLKLSAWLGIFTGGLGVAAVLLLKWSNLDTPLYYVRVSPYFFWAAGLSGLFLIGGGLSALLRLRNGRPCLCAAWGIALSVSILTFALTSLQTLRAMKTPEVPEIVTNYIAGIGILIVIAMLGWVMALLGEERQRR